MMTPTAQNAQDLGYTYDQSQLLKNPWVSGAMGAANTFGVPMAQQALGLNVDPGKWVSQRDQAEMQGQQAGQTMGGLAGSILGPMAAGAASGVVGGPVGLGVGAVVGLLSSMLGGEFGKAAGRNK